MEERSRLFFQFDVPEGGWLQAICGTCADLMELAHLVGELDPDGEVRIIVHNEVRRAFVMARAAVASDIVRRQRASQEASHSAARSSWE